ncbi:MAG: hypothetical protein H0T97_02910, partial [Actinobacteria bacterium]|nr:hypothetical protein [Actinomycetota bacterium]
VQAELPKHWSRKIEIYTALAAEAVGPAFDGQPLCVVVEEFPSEARATARVNAARISLDASQFRSRDRKREGRVAQALFGGVPQQQLMRRGVDTDVPLGAYLLDLVGGFCEYHAFVASGFVAAEDVGLPQQIEPADLKTAAELCGAALAGNQPARELVQHWIEAAATDRSWAEVTTEILDDWQVQDPHTVVGMALTAWAKINE